MKAVRIRGYGNEPAIDDIAMPEPTEGEVLMQVQAAALNPLDIQLQAGYLSDWFPLAFPFTLGTDFAGVVKRIGYGVTAFDEGDAIIARPNPSRGGGFAEYASVPAAACVRLPTPLTPDEGACIPTAGGTAWFALIDSANLKTGETVLIHAGAGGVGTFAIQFAKAAGARVLATASGDGVAFTRELGADRVIDYRSEDFAALDEPVDVVLDLIGGDTQARSFGLLRQGGRLVSTVSPPDAEKARSKGVSASMFALDLSGDRLAELVNAVVENRIRVVIDRKVALTDFRDAWVRQQSGHARAKTVLIP
ncbi:NADP-dependent oxidoreductase [Sphingomonas sp.]|uniref:NADP-dependent oxidoreductase n=1 Tax=Sphingomonas sp. TaxID=28214 RepID=UPI002580A9F8|nr:NADP-dependent oxidoreductase [Sphingomonas sp.]